MTHKTQDNLPAVIIYCFKIVER